MLLVFMARQSTPLARNTSTYMYTQPRRQAIPGNRDVTDVFVAARQRRSSATTIWVRVDRGVCMAVGGGGGMLGWR